MQTNPLFFSPVNYTRDRYVGESVTSGKSDLSTSVLESRGNGNNTGIRARHRPNDNIPGEKGLVQPLVCTRRYIGMLLMYRYFIAITGN